MQKVQYSRRAETLGKGQHWGPARTEAAAGGKDVQKNLSYSILACSGGDRPTFSELTVRLA